MSFQIESAIAVLERTPAALHSLLEGLPDAWIQANEGPDTFSPFDVVGHLIHGEQTDWMPRLQIILENGISKTFDPFDRFAMSETSQGKTLSQLLGTFESLREDNLFRLRQLNLSKADLDKRGRHPELGVVTAKQLLATWVAHDLGHLSQIVRVMARKYTDEVGPWRAYLRILNP